MFSNSLALFALLASPLLAVQALPIPQTVRMYRRATKGNIAKVGYDTVREPPEQWAFSLLESYKQYHWRYLTIGCSDAHDTDFFASCCRPRFAAQTDDDYAFACSAVAHVPATQVAALKKQMAAAGAEASSVRVKQIKSVASASSASWASAHPKPSTTSHVTSSAPKVSPTSSKATPSALSIHEASSSSVAPVTKLPDPAPAVIESSSSSSSKVVPTPQPKPAPTTTYQPPPAPSTTADSGSGSGGDSSSGGGGGLLSWLTGGEATFFMQKGVAGACGSVASDDTPVVAQYTSVYDNGANCGRHVTITNLNDGTTIDAVVRDECPTCTSEHSLDLSLGAFEQLTGVSGYNSALNIGTVPIKWAYSD